MITYNKNNIVIRDSVEDDVDYIAFYMKMMDVYEAISSHGISPEEAARRGLEDSSLCYTVANGKPIAMFGIKVEGVVAQMGVIWMLSTNELDKINIRFLKNCRRIIDEFLDICPYLYNYVHVENEKTIEWLEFCGAEFDPAQRYGLRGHDFRKFYFKRG